MSQGLMGCGVRISWVKGAVWKDAPRFPREKWRIALIEVHPLAVESFAVWVALVLNFALDEARACNDVKP